MSEKGISENLKKVRQFNRAIAGERARFLGVPDRKLPTILSSLDDADLIKSGIKYEQQLEAVKKAVLARRTNAKTGNIAIGAVGLMVLESGNTMLALYPYEQMYLGSAGKIEDHVVAMGLARNFNVFRANGYSPDGTPFPTDDQLRSGMELNLVLEGELHIALEGIIQNPHKMTTLHIYEGLILHVVTRNGEKHSQLQ